MTTDPRSLIRHARRIRGSRHPASGRVWRTGGSVELVVPASADVVYERISDVTRIGERSPECRSAAWEQGTPGTVGAVFRGRNRWGWAARWTRRCQVTEADPGRAFTFRTLPTSLDPTRRDSTTWSYQLSATEGGTRVRHSYQITKLPLAPLRLLYGVLLPQHRDMRPQMRANLAALADQLGSTAARPGRTPGVTGP